MQPLLRLFLVAAFGLGLTMSLSAQTDADRWRRHPERCVEEACRHYRRVIAMTPLL
jgi:hypothetical protein